MDNMIHIKQMAATDRLNELSNLDLVFSDPPWNTRKVQEIHGISYEDTFSEDGFQEFAEDIVQKAYKALKSNGTLAIWCDYRTHYQWSLAALKYGFKLGGEIIVESGLGRPSQSSWPMKHSNVMLYDKGTPYFNIEALPMVARLAAKAGYGDSKRVASVLWDGFSNTDPRRVGYPTEKNPTITEIIVKALCPDGGAYADVFCGSGSAAAFDIGNRTVYLSDMSDDSIAKVTHRLVTSVAEIKAKEIEIYNNLLNVEM